MTEQQINQIVENIRGISESPYIVTGTITGISLNPSNIEHIWTISTEKNSVANYSVKVDSLDDIVAIIHLFSGNSKDDISKTTLVISSTLLKRTTLTILKCL